MFTKTTLSKIKQRLTKLSPKANLFVFGIGLLVLVATLTIGAFGLFYNNKIFPGIKIAGISVGGKTRKEAAEALTSKVNPPQNITITSDDQEFNINLDSIDFSYDIPASVDLAYYLYRSKNGILNFIANLAQRSPQKNLKIVSTYSQEGLQDNLSVIAGQVAIEPINPDVSLLQGEVIVNKGSIGKELDLSKLKEKLQAKFDSLDFSPLTFNTTPTGETINTEEAQQLKERAAKLLDKKLTYTFEYETFDFDGEDLLRLLSVDGYSKDEIAKVAADLSQEITRDPQNAVFNFENGNVIEFKPAKDGVTLNQEELARVIASNLKQLESDDVKIVSQKIPVKTVSPEVTTENVNNLGIKELIGRGDSTFRGSIASRVHNIGLAASKLNGTLLAPGEALSFNAAVGDVSSLTGYKQAYIIKDGQTVLGDGGGVCQVSTTLFRAALDAGLPIIERRAHSYRVSYYEQNSPPGLDATVYAPTTDLKIKNDTPGHILVQTLFDSKTSSLIFELYGTSDGRVATTTKPIVTSVTPPPEDLYTDDPNLPAGEIKQIDYKAWGARVVFDYQVERDGEVIYEKTFYSNFKPWQAKFLRGTGVNI